MPLFNSTHFERQGNTVDDITLDSNNDIRESVTQLSTTALRNIKIFTPDLESPLYNNDDFRKNLLDFARGNRHAQIEILVTDTDSAIRQGHRLIHLAQQMTSALQIRNTPEAYQNENISFLLIDQSAFLFKANYTKQHAITSECNYRTNKLYDFFTLIWEQSTKNPNTQAFNL